MSVPTIVLSVCLVIGTCLLAWAYSVHRRGKISMAWPNVEATITSSVVTSSQSDGSSQPTYYPAVSYDYQVGGKTMESNRIGVGSAISYSQAGATAIATQYAVGKKVHAYYDPEDPSYAVLRRGANPNLVMSIAVGGVAIIVGGIVTMLSMPHRP